MPLEEVHRNGELLEALLMAHALDEDQLLFHSLPAGQKGLQETLEAMAGEHNEQRRILEDLRGETDAVKARRQLMHLIEMTREHAAVEERMLFGLAKRVLTEERLAELGEEYARRRGLSTSR